MGKVHSTNYVNALILPSEDCKARESMAPPKPGTVGAMQYEMIAEAPYGLTSDDLLVAITGARKEIPKDEWGALRDEIFSKGQPCLRASALVKSLGWAVHHDEAARVALVAIGSDRFDELMADGAVEKVKGMRSKRA